MFIQDQTGKVTFNMRFYLLKQIKNQIFIYDKQRNCLGIVAEYDNNEITKEILAEVIDIMKVSLHTRAYCTYRFPLMSEIAEVI